MFFYSCFSPEARLYFLRARIANLDRKIVFALSNIKKQCVSEKQRVITQEDVNAVVSAVVIGIPSSFRRHLSDDFLWNLVAALVMDIGYKDGATAASALIVQFITFVDKRVGCAKKVGRLKENVEYQLMPRFRHGSIIN